VPRRSTLDNLKFPSYCLGDLSCVDVKEYLKYSDTILIPKASLEQHGPHLPLFCDSISSTEVARRAGQKAGILYTPTLWLGYYPQPERDVGRVKDVLERPREEPPGWHASELETSRCLCHSPKFVRMDRAVMDKAHAPKWLAAGANAWKKSDGMPDGEFQGYQY